MAKLRDGKWWSAEKIAFEEEKERQARLSKKKADIKKKEKALKAMKADMKVMKAVKAMKATS
jgi:hypothetical protein